MVWKSFKELYSGAFSARRELRGAELKQALCIQSTCVGLWPNHCVCRCHGTWLLLIQKAELVSVAMGSNFFFFFLKKQKHPSSGSQSWHYGWIWRRAAYKLWMILVPYLAYIHAAENWVLEIACAPERVGYRGEGRKQLCMQAPEAAGKEWSPNVITHLLSWNTSVRERDCLVEKKAPAHLTLQCSGASGSRFWKVLSSLMLISSPNFVTCSRQKISQLIFNVH